MNKKGSHTDWVISIGIFLVYLVGLFILLRPGVTPVYKPEFLLENLERNFMNNVSWEVSEIPLFVEKCIEDTRGGNTIETRIEIKDEHTPDALFRFSNVIEPAGEDYDTEDGNTFTLECFGEDTTTARPSISSPPLKKFILVYYPTERDSINPEFTEKDNMCTTNKDEEKCKAYLGASTSKSGIKEEWLTELENINYADLKTQWGFPDEKEFAIYVSDSNSLVQKIGIKDSAGNFVGPPQGVSNIFVKEIKTNILSDEGILTPTTINLRVW